MRQNNFIKLMLGIIILAIITSVGYVYAGDGEYHEHALVNCWQQQANPSLPNKWIFFAEWDDPSMPADAYTVHNGVVTTTMTAYTYHFTDIEMPQTWQVWYGDQLQFEYNCGNRVSPKIEVEANGYRVSWDDVQYENIDDASFSIYPVTMSYYLVLRSNQPDASTATPYDYVFGTDTLLPLSTDEQVYFWVRAYNNSYQPEPLSQNSAGSFTFNIE